MSLPIPVGRGVLLAVDPGVNAGVAVFMDGRLMAATVICAPDTRDKHHPDPDAHDDHAQEIALWAVRCTPRLCIDAYAFEWPNLHAKDKSEGKNLNSFFGLVALGQAVRAHLQCPSAAFYPEQWKGQIPKPKPGQEYMVVPRVRERLDQPGELDAIDFPRESIAHNGYDALGVGLHAVGRGLLNARKRVFPR